MNRNALILIIVVILVIVGAAALMMGKQTITPPAAGNTLLALENHATDHQVHAVAVAENISKADGSLTNIYIDSWTQPGGNVTVDLSRELGYNGSLPAGTTFTLKMWLDPHGNKTGNATLNMTVHGGTEDKIADETKAYLLTASHVFYPLSTITSNQVNVTQDPAKGAEFLKGIRSVYVEILITVNADGTVTITQLAPPVLCTLAAGG
ncbi:MULTISPECIES: hypothetical protein [Methanothermobacter]|uniref:Uncharacterized protein n=1 Tax=Methanothermobacter marburgensis (strain ATCC BAA-927 / DSM 2133 / JCM 14651 / NBRC 100331 / OCM 82 / Marburg) TaxID=79929 RepID=D9PWL4_METTM|nr:MULTISPECIES: hypothetical protein [Methanothermobacter]ADL58612.1 conserved hypothetical protein [Methanothermobacter marburgensis str. Marburg]QHN08190.1 hypothetical protein FZP68_05240 [Methanothermobacter sp. THM-2]WBF09198.1 hypothetical protein ISG34_05025 [Methanothermobacter marburgensis]